MKNLLIATTALVATATVAAADISVSGYGRFGLVYQEQAAGSTTNEMSQYSRFQAQFNGTTTADNGTTFSGSLRIRPTSGTGTVAAPQVSIATGGMTAYAGNIPGPLETLANAYGKTVGFSGGTFNGLVNQADNMAFASTGAGAQGVQVDYAAGGFTVKLAHQFASEDNQASITYNMGAVTIAAGTQMSDTDADDETVVTLGYNMDAASVALASSDNNGNRKTTVSASADMGGASLSVYYTDDESDTDNAYGVGVSYGMGGGVTFGAGIERDFDTLTRAEAGFTFNF